MARTFVYRVLAVGAAWAVASAVPQRVSAESGPRSGELAELSVEELLEVSVDVVTSASKHEQLVSRAPAAVTVITAEEIRDLGHRTLADVLEGVRGFFTVDDRNYARLAVRGLGRPGDYSTRVLLLVDGHQLNDNLYDMAAIGNEVPLDLELVERVEVVRGPASALYGGNAMFAVVNLVTRAPRAGARSSATLGGGSFGAKRGRVEYAGHGSVLAALSAFDTTGPSLSYPEFAATPGGGIARDLDWERGGRAFLKMSRGGLRLVSGIGLREKGIPTGAFGVVFADDRAATRDVRAFAEAAWDGAIAPSLSASFRAYADEYRYLGEYPYDEGGSVAVYGDDHRGRWLGTEGRVRWEAGMAAVTAGVEGRLNLRQDMRSGYPGRPLDVDVRRSHATGAGYAQAELAPLSWLQLTMGGRLDAHADFGTVASPRAALIIAPREGTAVKLLGGTAFRPPNVYERFYYMPDRTATLALRPETIRTSEVVVEQSAWTGARVSASAYRWDLFDIISESENEEGLASFSNGGKVSARGLELELEQRFRGHGTARASWALQRSEDEEGRELTNSPRHLAKLQLNAPTPWQPLHGGVEVLYASSRRTLAGGEAGAHLTANLSATLRGLARGRFDVRATVRNLLGQRYGDPGSNEHVQDVLLRDGRTLNVEIVGRF